MREFLAPLIASLPSPIVSCDCADPELPDGPVGTLIVHDLGWLARAHQQHLLDWLNGRGRGARVVATSARPVFPVVRRGMFSADLYYRLNTITLRLRGPRRARQVGCGPRVAAAPVSPGL